MIKIAVCDDDNVIVGKIEEILLNVSTSEKIPVDIDAFCSGKELEKIISQGFCYDIIYLDIQMEDTSGIETAQIIRKADQKTVIIFVSGYSSYVFDTFQFNTYAFIRKPFEELDFTKVFLGAIKHLGIQDFYYSFNHKGKHLKFPCKEIMYFESLGRTIILHLCNGEEITFYGKLNDVESELKTGKIPFLRIHQSFLVNYHLIRVKSRTDITLTNGKKLPISNEKQKDFKVRYLQLVKGDVNV